MESLIKLILFNFLALLLNSHTLDTMLNLRSVLPFSIFFIFIFLGVPTCFI